jgi:hypothetical protein
MPSLIVPLQREFKIIEGPSLSKEDPLIVTIRQATQGDALKRQEMLSRPVTRKWEGEDGFSVAEELTPFAKRMAVDTWLTMTSCNITMFDGKTPLFPLKNGKIQLTFDQFMEKWGQLPPEWAEAIYNKCLLLNPTWGFGVSDENEDEEALTEGEDAAGEPATESQPSSTKL